MSDILANFIVLADGTFASELTVPFLLIELLLFSKITFVTPLRGDIYSDKPVFGMEPRTFRFLAFIVIFIVISSIFKNTITAYCCNVAYVVFQCSIERIIIYLNKDNEKTENLPLSKHRANMNKLLLGTFIIAVFSITYYLLTRYFLSMHSANMGA